MLRGIITFRCDKCGHTFQGMDVEWNASALSTPRPCPKCGSFHTMPGDLLSLFSKPKYREIWREMDEQNKHPQ